MADMNHKALTQDVFLAFFEALSLTQLYHIPYRSSREKRDCTTRGKAGIIYINYLFLLLKGFETKILHEHAKEGTTVNSIRFDELLTMPVPLPPKLEQMRIVDRIDGILSII